MIALAADRLSAWRAPDTLQVLWKRRDWLATNELLNFGDAVENFERVDRDWLGDQLSAVKTGDEGNRAGAIFELLGLNFFLSAGAKVVPSGRSNPGYDGVVELPDSSSLIVSIKNHGITSYERLFHNRAMEIGDQFTGWLNLHARSGELRILSQDRLDGTGWGKLKQDLKDILNEYPIGEAPKHQVRGC